MSKLHLAAAAAVLFCAVIPALATDYNPPFPPLVIDGDQTPIIYPDFPVELVVSEAQSGGQFGMAVMYQKPDEGSPKLALAEAKLTETFYVLEGQFRFYVGDEVYEGGPGTVVVNPPHLPHSSTNIGPGIGRLLVIYTPVDSGPMKGTDFFVQWAAQSTRSLEWIARTNADYGIDRPAP